MKKHNISVLILAAAFSFVLLSPAGSKKMPGPAGVAHAQDDWKKEFDSVCARTQDADAMTPDELKNLVDRSDKLVPRIEKLDETQKKVYLKRLRMCRDLFAFVLESKEIK